MLKTKDNSMDNNMDLSMKKNGIRIKIMVKIKSWRFAQKLKR